MTTGIIVLFCVVCAVATSNVLFVENAQMAGLQTFAFVADLSSSVPQPKTVSSPLNTNNGWPSAGVVCGGFYFAVQIDYLRSLPQLLRVDLSNADSTTLQQNTLYHSLYCDNNSTLRAVKSLSGDTVASFYLVALTFTGTETVLTEIPSTGYWEGWDTIFSWNSAQGEFWAAMSINGEIEQSGVLNVFDAHSGASKANYSFPYFGGIPYYLLPTGGDTFYGIISANSGENLYWSRFTLESTSVSVTRLFESTSPMWTAGVPPCLCGDVLWFAQQDDTPSQYNVIVGVDPVSGKNISEIDMGKFLGKNALPQAALGGLACLP